MNKFERITLATVAVLMFLVWLLGSMAFARDTQDLVSFEPTAYQFISEHAPHLDTNDMPPVKYQFKTQEQLNLMYYNKASVDNFNVEAIYAAGVIYLRDDFDLELMSHTLVHELVHHVQFVNARAYECHAAMEREAYTVMDKWVDSTGVGEKTDILFMMMLNCRLEQELR